MSSTQIIATDSTPHLATTDVQFRRILLAIDFSHQTSEVIKAAIRIARVFNSELFLVNAAAPAVYGTGAEPVPIETFDVNLQIAQARMAELINSEMDLATVPHQEIIEYANAVDLIQQVIDSRYIDLVIAGSHGACGMERLAIGSVAECILRTVRCPVLVLGPRATIPPDIFRSILLATRLTTADLRSAQYAAALAEHFHSDLTLLHVMSVARNQATVMPEVLEKQLQELIPQNFTVFATAVTRVEHGRPGEVVPSIALGLRSTLVVTGARDESPLADHAPRATVAEIIRRSPCPVLCIRGHVR